VFTCPYARSRDALTKLGRNGDADACHGSELRFINQATGGSPMPTIAAFTGLEVLSSQQGDSARICWPG
jgi:gentisate 1,2-dioxygenase